MIEAYSHSKHFDFLSKWLSHYGIPAPDKRFFSADGLVVDNCAIGFLFKTTNSKTAYIDNIAADPSVSKEKRDGALHELISELERLAKAGGFLLITVLANLSTMRERFSSHGFFKSGEFGLYFKHLGDN